MQTQVGTAHLFAWFPVAFVLMWLAITTMLSLVASWYALVAAYPDRQQPVIKQFSWQSAKMGIVSLSTMLTFAATADGLRISMFRLMGPFSRPFLVPWSEIRSSETLWFGIVSRTKLAFGTPEIGTLTLSSRVWDSLAGATATVVRCPATRRTSLELELLLQWLLITAAAAAFFSIPRLSAHGGGLPIGVAFAFPAVVFGVGQVIRYVLLRIKG